MSGEEDEMMIKGDVIPAAGRDEVMKRTFKRLINLSTIVRLIKLLTMSA